MHRAPVPIFSIMREYIHFHSKIYTALIWESIRSEFGRAHLPNQAVRLGHVRLTTCRSSDQAVLNGTGPKDGVWWKARVYV